MPGPEFGFGRLFVLSAPKDQGAQRAIPVTGGPDLDEGYIKAKWEGTKAGSATAKDNFPKEQKDAVRFVLQALLGELSEIKLHRPRRRHQ